MARNLAGVRCPKVLVVGDTHHICAPGRGPIWRPVSYALAESYDLVIGEFNRHHMHFFREAGIKAGWVPCFTLSPFEHGVETKKHDVTFVGQTGRHPFRHHVLEQLGAMGVAVGRGSAPRKETALLHAQSRINLNISLNGDLNLRHFEVLAAGGFLLTEKLSPESGLPLLLDEQKHMAVFDNVVQLAEMIRYYLANPALAAEMAAAGHAEYMRFHRPELKVQQMYDMLAGRTPDVLDLRHDRRTALPAEDADKLRGRVAVYE
ncbi:MAG TPA: glycosyltransferase, partial [Phycisphaerae bacterium]|nr:glycosyltransferase [Phycisphaerae bacterium]